MSRSCFTLALLCGASACSVYSPDLRNGALSSAGSDGIGGTGANTAGGSAGAGETTAAGQAGSFAGGAAQGGSGGAGSGEAGSNGNAGNTSVAGSAAGGTSAGGSGGGASNLDLIDNLEDGNDIIRLVNTPKRDGIWDSGNDGTTTGKQTPVPGSFKPAALLPADAPYAGDKAAAYSKASGFSSYGAFMNVSMRSWPDYDTTYPKYDASAYKGLSFLAKAGTGSSLGMRVRFISGDTDPRGGKCKVDAPPTTYPQDQLCYNHYYSVVTLTNTWATYTLSFADDFFQGMAGMVNPTIDLKEMYGLEFYFGAGEDYELWVDDLSFIKN